MIGRMQGDTKDKRPAENAAQFEISLKLLKGSMRALYQVIVGLGVGPGVGVGKGVGVGVGMG